MINTFDSYIYHQPSGMVSITCCPENHGPICEVAETIVQIYSIIAADFCRGPVVRSIDEPNDRADWTLHLHLTNGNTLRFVDRGDGPSLTNMTALFALVRQWMQSI